MKLWRSATITGFAEAFKVQAACATLAQLAAEPGRLCGRPGSGVDGRRLFQDVASSSAIRPLALAAAAAAARRLRGDTRGRPSLGSAGGAQPVHLLDQPRGRHHRHPAGRGALSRLDAGAGASAACTTSLENLGEPVTAINEVVQGDPRPRRHHDGALPGQLDARRRRPVRRRHAASASARPRKDAGKTIGYYAGVEPENGGFYIVLPLVGPSNARDAVGLVVDYRGRSVQHPHLRLSNTAGWIYAGPRFGATVIDTRSRTLFALDDLEKNSVDYYAALRSAYTQQRAEHHPPEAGQDRPAGRAGAARQSRAGALGLRQPFHCHFRSDR